MNKSVITGIIALVIVGALGFFVLAGGDDSDDSDDNSSAQSSEMKDDDEHDEDEHSDDDGHEDGEEGHSDDETSNGITMAEVASHSTADDCWTYVGENVYDITEYIPRHPGGDTILMACGADGTSLFEQRTTSEGEQVGSGTPHSGSAASQLESFLVGELAN